MPWLTCMEVSEMLFHEIYGKYFRTVAAILREASDGELDIRRIRQIVSENAFAESTMTIPDALTTGKWPLLDEGGMSVLLNPPEMGITLLEKRWLKSLLSDPRIALFDVPAEGLEGVDPLYDPERIVWFDRYADGDPYTDAQYIHCFRSLCTAIREKQWVSLNYESAKGKRQYLRALPHRMDYSEKDDKFRLRIHTDTGPMTLNVARIRECELRGATKGSYTFTDPENRLLVLELTDRRNTLERTMLHFSHLRKETIRLDDDRYLLKLWYSPEDEREMLIRVLSFGPMVKVLAPDSFVSLVRARIRRQQNLFTP